MHLVFFCHQYVFFAGRYNSEQPLVNNAPIKVNLFRRWEIYIGSHQTPLPNFSSVIPGCAARAALKLTGFDMASMYG